MYTGVHINNTEDRAVLHTALRRPAEDEGKYIVDGQDTVKDVRETLDRMNAFAEQVRKGERKGVTGKEIETVVNIGIGGSDRGPVLAYEALTPFADAGIKARYVSNIDPKDIAEKTRELDPETTLIVFVSKTFGTHETLKDQIWLSIRQLTPLRPRHGPSCSVTTTRCSPRASTSRSCSRTTRTAWTTSRTKRARCTSIFPRT